MPRISVARRWLLGAALPLLLLAVTLAGCVSLAGGASSAVTPSPLGIPKVTADGKMVDPLAFIYFRASSDFYDALQSVTNLGLQPVEDCTGYTSAHVRWQAQDEHRWFKSIAPQPLMGIAPTELPALQSQPQPKATVQWRPQLEVTPTPLAPSDWLQRLAALPGVVMIDDNDSEFIGCSLIREDLTPVPGVVYFLGEKVWAEDVRVQFAAAGASGGGVGYGAALATISGLGFRLADPCYEQSLPPPPWRPMGQQASFASSGALIVAITAANSTAWLAQLQGAAGVVSVQAPYAQACATH